MDPYRQQSRSNGDPVSAQQGLQYLGDGLTFPAQISIRAAFPTSTQRDSSNDYTRRDSAAPSVPEHAPPYPRGQDRRDHDRRHQERSSQPEDSVNEFGENTRSRYTDRPQSDPRPFDFEPAGRALRTPRPSRSEAREHEPHRRPGSNRLITNLNEYNIIRPLGPSGSRSSTFYLVENVATRELFALKRILMGTGENRERAQLENNALKQIMRAGTSPHITTLAEGYYDGISDYSNLVLEYCEHGSLDSLIKRYLREHKVVPEKFAWHVLHALASALCMCHYGLSSIEQVHRLRGPHQWDSLLHLDIRPRNVLLTSNHRDVEYPRIVLGDFSAVARPVDVESGMDRIIREIGHPRWQPRESCSPHDRGLYGGNTDIWQIGGVVQAICRLLESPEQFLADEKRACGSMYSETLNGVVSWCMSSDFRDRPTAVDLLAEMARIRDVGY